MKNLLIDSISMALIAILVFCEINNPLGILKDIGKIAIIIFIWAIIFHAWTRYFNA
jgi:hypothetical protein